MTERRPKETYDRSIFIGLLYHGILFILSILLCMRRKIEERKVHDIYDDL